MVPRAQAEPPNAGRPGAVLPHAEPPDAEALFVWVFRYSYWDEESQAHERSWRFATLDMIRSGLGEPIHSTAKKVRVNDLIDGAFAD